VSRPYLVLRHPDFRNLWMAHLVSWIGSQMQTAALHWHVYLLTRSPLALGFVGLTRVLPLIVFSLWGGVEADRRDRRKVLLLTQTALTIVATSLALATFLDRDRLWLIYTLNALQAAASAFDGPSRSAYIPRLVPPADLPAAITLNLTIFQGAIIIGPALAGVVLASAASWLPLGPRGAPALIYALNALSFLGVLLVLARIRTSGAPAPGVPAEAGSPIAAMREGLRFVFTTPIMVWTMTLDFFATFFAGAVSLLPVFADQVLHVGPRGYGWLVAAPGVGALIGSLYTSVRPLPQRQGRVLLWAVAGYGVATIVYGLSRSFVLTLFALALTGLADVISTVIRQTLRQVLTPDGLRGRMTSVNSLFFLGGPQLGELEAGLVASLFATIVTGVTVSVVSGGFATILVAAVVGFATRTVRDHQAPQ
jgi:MFS family permease